MDNLDSSEEKDKSDTSDESGLTFETEESPYSGFALKVDEFFSVTKRKSTIMREILAGITTFLSMAYILTVNPNQLLMLGGTKDIRWPSIFIATCLGSLIGTLMMAFLAKMPYAQAPGMGLNSTMGTLIAFGLSTYGFTFTFENAMALGFIYAVIVLIISIVPCMRDSATGKLIPMREKLFDGIPICVRCAMPVGIGLFIAFIGMQNGLVTDNQFVLVSLSDWKTLWRSQGTWAEYLLAKKGILIMICLLVMAVLSHLNVPGAVVIGILFGTIIGIPMDITSTDIIAGKADISWKFWKNFENYFKWDSDKGGIFFSCFRGFDFPKGSAGVVIVMIISLGMIDLFDTMGTVVGCATKADLNDEDGKPESYGPIMYSDSIASVCASLLGTSSVTTYVESGSGIAAGGRTGIVALTVSVLFFLAIFLLPIFAFIPGAAAGAALIWVGVLMMTTVKHVDFSDMRDAVAAFFTIAMMPLTYSITNGIGLGLLTYVIIHLLCWICEMIKWAATGKEAARPPLQISIITGVIAILFIVYFFVPTHY